MSFSGKFVLESREKYKDFLDAIGVKQVEIDNEDFVTDMYQGAYFRIAKFMGSDVWTNTFMFGREVEMEDMDGTTFKTTVRLEGNKLKIQFPKYVYTAEIAGDKLVETNTIGGITNKMVSKRQAI
ncbi:gastrotropin-like [Dunckerocampus dactyliophorus]|uniref:gastrotropin-like n=1 Tax=Dunckerocampus dactyliophorus TaxID=161453 RepID=UPI0024055F79|nr:gastrotropin-like [Dunckerocampus dactyliophorus]